MLKNTSTGNLEVVTECMIVCDVLTLLANLTIYDKNLACVTEMPIEQIIFICLPYPINKRTVLK